MCVHARDTVRAQSGNVPALAYTHQARDTQVKRAKHQYCTTNKGFGWVGHQKGRVERPQAAARHSSSHESRALREGCRKSVKGVSFTELLP